MKLLVLVLFSAFFACGCTTMQKEQPVTIATEIVEMVGWAPVINFHLQIPLLTLNIGLPTGELVTVLTITPDEVFWSPLDTRVYFYIVRVIHPDGTSYYQVGEPPEGPITPLIRARIFVSGRTTLPDFFVD